MNRIIICFLTLLIPLFCVAQTNLIREYDYDEAGNRILRKTIQITLAPPAPPDSTFTDEDLQTLMPLESLNPPLETVFFVENISQVEIKIYPNPTSEKVTLEISNMEQLQAGNFKLYSLSGQLLQEHPVHSATTTVSLAGLPSGAYILKVYINEHVEDWKIIKK